MTRMTVAVVALLLAGAPAAQAATEAQLQAAFAKAQKKGAVAVMDSRCGGHSSVYFPGAKRDDIAKTAAALTALVAANKDTEDAGCPGGLHEGESRVLELYPDGTVRPH